MSEITARSWATTLLSSPDHIGTEERYLSGTLLRETAIRAELAEAKLAKVEALAKEWEGRAGWTEEGRLYFRTHARRLREAMK